jgi:hypothetical protein
MKSPNAVVAFPETRVRRREHELAFLPAALEIVGVAMPTAAVTVPFPSMRSAVNVVVLPTLGAIVPAFGGVSDHVADTGTTFPYESLPATVKR